MGVFVQYTSHGKAKPGQFKYLLTISGNNGADAFARHCNRRFMGAKVEPNKSGCINMTGEMKAGRKERLAMPYTLKYKGCSVRVMEDKHLPEDVTEFQPLS